MSKQDLQPLSEEGLGALDWSQEPAEAAQKVKTYVTAKVRKAVGWYYAGKRLKKWAAWWFRGGMILLTAAAGTLPLVNEIHQGWQQDRQVEGILRQQAEASTSTQVRSNAPPATGLAAPLRATRLFDPVWSAVLLALAGTLLALDRFHGSTSGWVRYVLTAQQLTEALDDFELAFQSRRLDWAGGKPTLEQARAALEQTQKFLRQANGIVHDETGVWAAEFAEALKQLETQTRAASRTDTTSAAGVAPPGGAQPPPGGHANPGTPNPPQK